MDEDTSQRKTEVATLCAGIGLGLTLIDITEMHADGSAERVIGEALIGLRESTFLISRAHPWNIGGQKVINTCETSLRRLSADYLNLYLLHQSGSFVLEETATVMEKLIAQGKIRYRGVFDLGYADMQKPWQLPGGDQCATNQVLYHLGSQEVEYDPLSWCQKQQMLTMVYNPLVQVGRLRNGLLKNAVVSEIAYTHNISAAQALLTWVTSHQGVIVIPRAATVVHVQQNAAVLGVEPSSVELVTLDKAYPAPKGEIVLDTV